MKKFFKAFTTLLLFFTLTSCADIHFNTSSNSSSDSNSSTSSSSKEDLGYATYTFENITYNIYEDNVYTGKYEVAIYIHAYHKLPSNYYTKRDDKPRRTVENKVAIGGDHFGNREGHLPAGRSYTEVDIVEPYQEKSYNLSNKRGKNRIVYSNLFEIYFTSDHYVTFDRIYFND